MAKRKKAQKPLKVCRPIVAGDLVMLRGKHHNRSLWLMDVPGRNRGETLVCVNPGDVLIYLKAEPSKYSTSVMHYFLFGQQKLVFMIKNEKLEKYFTAVECPTTKKLKVKK